MLLRTIELQGWRCFANPISVGPFTDGLNIVYGPNGSGKSTLLWALARGLFDNHSVGAKTVKEIQSWGKSLNPQVTITFEHDDSTFRVRKRFINDRLSELEEKQGGSFVRIAESNAANQKVRDMLSGEKPSRGVTKRENWGFAQVLWSMQGDFRIYELAEGTQNTIADSLGAQMVGPQDGEIEKEVKSLYESVFTKGGKLIAGAKAHPLVQRREALEVAQSELQKWKEKNLQFEEHSIAIQTKRQTLEGRQRELEQCDTKIANLQADLEKWNKLTAQHEGYQKDEELAAQKVASVTKQLEQIAQNQQWLTQTRGELERLKQEEAAINKAVEQSQSDLAKTSTELAQLRKKTGDIEQSMRIARRAEKFVSNKKDAEAAVERHRKVQELDKQIATLQKQQAQIHTPTRRQLADIEKAIQQQEVAKVQYEAALISLEVIAESDLNIEVQMGDSNDDPAIKPGEVFQVKAVAEVELRVPGVGVFRASGPSESAAALSQQLQQANKAVDEKSAGFSNVSVAELHERLQQNEAIREKIQAGESEKKAILAGQSVEELSADVARLQAITQEFIDEFPLWADETPNWETLTENAEQEQSSHVQQLHEANAKHERAQQAKITADRNADQFRTKSESLGKSIAQYELQIAQLTADADESQLKETQLDFQIEKRNATTKQAAIQKQLEQLQNPAASIEELKGLQQGLRDTLKESAGDIHNREGRLSSLAELAPYSRVAEYEEKIAALKIRIARDEVQTDAIRLLHDVIEDERTTAIDTLVGPVQQRATQTLKRIAGSRFDRIEFDEKFNPQSVRPHEIEGEVPINQLSGGEEEQVHFAVRLALADIAFQDQRQLVVLDDAFTATDSDRLLRITTILQEAAQRFQIVLLSCHPERYRHLPGTTLFDLEKIVQQTRDVVLDFNDSSCE